MIKDFKTKNDSCFKFKLEELNSDFLELLTKIHAYNVSDFSNNPDNMSNWIQGKKLTAFNIIECYLIQCNDKGDCIPVPECCHEYLKEININDVKEYMAYFIWEKGGRNWNDSADIRKIDYLEGCNQIMSFCRDLVQKGENCKYNNDILCKIDRRTISDRRTLLDRRQKNMKINYEERRCGKERRNYERRVYDHRGLSAQYLGSPPF